MKKVIGFFLALVLCLAMGLLLPRFRGESVSLAREEYRGIWGQEP